MTLRAIQDDFRLWLVQESAAAATRLGGTKAAPGLAVYLNTYRGQLMTALADTFAMLRAWLGAAAFDAAAAQHIERVPPGSWTLDAYGRDFPDTLRLLHPHDPEVVELACLERTLSDAFVGPDCAPMALEALSDTDWEQAVLHLMPTFMLLPVTTNAAAIWSALTEGSPPPQAALLETPTQLAVWRGGFTPRFRTLDPAEAGALAGIAGGMSFGELCARLVEQHGAADGAALAGTWLGQWLRDGCIAAVN